MFEPTSLSDFAHITVRIGLYLHPSLTLKEGDRRVVSTGSSFHFSKNEGRLPTVLSIHIFYH